MKTLFDSEAEAQRVAARLTKLRGVEYCAIGTGPKWYVREKCPQSVLTGIDYASVEYKILASSDDPVPGGALLDYPTEQVATLKHAAGSVAGSVIGSTVGNFEVVKPKPGYVWQSKELALCKTKLVSSSKQFYLIEVPDSTPGSRWLGKDTVEWASVTKTAYAGEDAVTHVAFIIKVAILKKNKMTSLLPTALLAIPKISGS